MKKILIALVMVVLAAGSVWGEWRKEGVPVIQSEGYRVFWGAPSYYKEQHFAFIYTIMNTTSNKNSVCPKIVLVDGNDAQHTARRDPVFESNLKKIMADDPGEELYNLFTMCGEIYPGARKTGVAIFNIKESGKPEVTIYITNVFERDYMVSFRQVDQDWIETGGEWVR